MALSVFDFGFGKQKEEAKKKIKEKPHLCEVIDTTAIGSRDFSEYMRGEIKLYDNH